MEAQMFFEMLCGPIASGKSTWTTHRANQGALVSNDDAFVTALHGGNYKLYDPNLKKLYKGMEALVLHMGAAIRRDVVIDRTNMTVAQRARYISFAKSIDVPIVCIVFPNEGIETHARRRFEADARGHTYEKWLSVAKEMDAIYEQPRLSEGFDLVVTLGQAKELDREGIWTRLHSER